MNYKRKILFMLMLTSSSFSVNATLDNKDDQLYEKVTTSYLKDYLSEKLQENHSLKQGQGQKLTQQRELELELKQSTLKKNISLKQIIDKSIEDLPEIKSWKDVRKLFAFSDHLPLLIPMNSANFSPPFDYVSKTSAEFQKDLDLNVHMQHRIDQFKKLVDEDGREIVAQHLKISTPEDKKNIAFMRNSSEANNAISSGYIFKKPEGKVLLWEENHPTNNKFTWSRKLQIGDNSSRIKIVKTESFTEEGKDEITKQGIINAFLNAIDEDTEIVTFTEISNITGIRIPSQELSQKIRSKYPNIHIHVDGAQSLGDLDLNFNNIAFDSFSSSFHKWLAGPREVGLLYMKQDAVKNFRSPNIIAYDGQIVFPEKLPDNASRFELLGQRNDASLLAIYTTFKIHELINDAKLIKDGDGERKTNIHRRVSFLGGELISKLKKEDFTVVTPENADIRHGTIVVDLPKSEKNSIGIGDDYYKYLYELGFKDNKDKVGFLTAGALDNGDGNGHQGLRICVNFYNNEDDIDEVVAAMVQYRDKGKGK